MRDELSHIRNQADEHRRHILHQHQKYMDGLFAKYPSLKSNYLQVDQIKKRIIGMTLAKLSGQALDKDIIELEQQLEALRLERLSLLKQFNLEPKSIQPKWDCQRCQDTGRVYIDDEKFIICECYNSRKDDLQRLATALPSRIAMASFDKVNVNLYQPQFRSQARKIFTYVQKFCDDISKTPGQGLFIHGPTGSGKSYLMGCIANYLCSHMSVKYLVYADFLDSLRATFNSRETGSSEQQLIDEVKNVGLLLLDDLGVEKPTEFSLKNLAQIIDYRYRNCLPLVVTSNFTLDELIRRSQADLYGERIVWRLSECCTNMLELKGNLRLNL